MPIRLFTRPIRLFTAPIWAFTMPIRLFTMADPAVHDADPAVHDGPIWLFTMGRFPHVVVRLHGRFDADALTRLLDVLEARA